MKRKHKDFMMKRREYEIINFVKDNPGCYKDSLFTKGKITKSRLTYQLIEKLISEKKITMWKTKNCRERYTTEDCDGLKIFECVMENKEWDLYDKIKMFPSISKKLLKLCSSYSAFFPLRLKILNYEHKRAKINNLPLILRNTDIVIDKIFEFLLYPTPEDLIKLQNLIESEMRRDQYFWDHERHASVKRRSVEYLFEMRENPHKIKSYNKNRDFREIKKKISGQRDLSDKWLAEMGSSIYKNSEKIPKMNIIKTLKKKIIEIQKDPSKLNEHTLEIREIKFALGLLKKLSLNEIFNDPKLGSQFIMKPLLGDKYEERIRDNYRPEDMRLIYREKSEEAIRMSVIFWDKFIAASKN